MSTVTTLTPPHHFDLTTLTTVKAALRITTSGSDALLLKSLEDASRAIKSQIPCFARGQYRETWRGDGGKLHRLRPSPAQFILALWSNGDVVDFSDVTFEGPDVVRRPGGFTDESTWTMDVWAGYLMPDDDVSSSNIQVIASDDSYNLTAGATVWPYLVAGDIVLVAGLSYLGLGVRPPAPEWGAMINEGRTFMATAWWISAFPGLAIVVTGVAFSIFGDGLADALRPGRR